MFDWDRFVRAATAAFGALVLSFVSVGAAVGPAASLPAGTSIAVFAQAGAAAHG
jgi:hypothetical protein